MAENLERSSDWSNSQPASEAHRGRLAPPEMLTRSCRRNSMPRVRERRAFYELLAADPAVTDHLSRPTQAASIRPGICEA